MSAFATSNPINSGLVGWWAHGAEQRGAFLGPPRPEGSERAFFEIRSRRPAAAARACERVPGGCGQTARQLRVVARGRRPRRASGGALARGLDLPLTLTRYHLSVELRVRRALPASQRPHGLAVGVERAPSSLLTRRELSWIAASDAGPGKRLKTACMHMSAAGPWFTLGRVPSC